VAKHVILSWAPKDAKNITDVMLKDIASEFIRLRASNCVVIGTKHVEKDYIHLHLAVSNQLNGRSSRVSKGQFQAIKKSLQQYELERYGQLLSHSRPEHGKKNAKEVPEKNIKRNERFIEKIIY
jgi:hypothetical protein